MEINPKTSGFQTPHPPRRIAFSPLSPLMDTILPLPDVLLASPYLRANNFGVLNFAFYFSVVIVSPVR